MNTKVSELAFQRLFCRLGLLHIDNESRFPNALCEAVRCIFHSDFPFLK